MRERPRTTDRTPPRPRRRLGRIVVGGGAVVGLAAVGWAGYTWLTLPDVGAFSTENPSTTAFIDRYRESRGDTDPPVDWQWVAYPDISPHLKRAVVSSEDLEFFSHNGFSSHEMREALRQAWRRRRFPRGASTITQQLAKNLWLSPSRNPLRKIREAILTRQLERLGKHRILEIYLNVVEFGPGIYGAEAAARHYFGIGARHLTEHQAAELAAGLPRPRTWNPSSERRAYRAAVGRILDTMERAEFLHRRFRT